MENAMKKTAVVMIFALGLVLAASAQQPGTFSLLVGANGDFGIADSAALFSFNPGAVTTFEYRLKQLPFLYLVSQVPWTYYLPTNLTSFNAICLLAGGGIQFDLIPWLALKADVSSGAYYASMSVGSQTLTAFNPALAARAGVGFRFGNLLIDVLGGYTNYFGLSSSMGVNVSAGWQFGGSSAAVQKPQPVEQKPKPLEEQKKPAEQPKQDIPKAPEPEKPAPLAAVTLGDASIEPIFPVFYKYYDDHSLGTVTITNETGSDISDVKLTLWVKQYMDGPKGGEGSASIKAGESATFQLYAIFTDKILDINEATKAQAQLDLSYTLNGKSQTQSAMQTIRILDRNAMTWDDDRRAAAFVSSKDPGVMSFAKRVANLVKKNSNYALNANLQLAAGMHEGLSLYGIGYVKDPKSASIASGAKKSEPDFLQFARQTLEFKSGDCDDLTILYCSLFESVGVETAFITIPGHIYMAFSPELSAADARKSFVHVDNLIILGDRVWIPIEVTDRSDFLTAWQSGAREWRENQARGEAHLYEVHEAWKLYEPAGLAGSGPAAQFPDEAKLTANFKQVRDGYVDGEISASVATLQAQVKQSKESAKSLNALGVLYARYGLFDKAVMQFEKVVKKEDHVPSLLNLGTICYQQGQRDKAIAYYERAYSKQPSSAQVLLALARVNHDVENYYAVKKYYTELKSVDAALAEQFSYLDLKGEEASRAAEVSGAKEVMLWAE
jgi:hypothetical protein